MRLKSYFAQSIGDAIESARLELGPEAMLLNSRRTSPEQNYLGEYEVVFGITGNPPAQKRSALAERPASTKLSSAKRIFPELVAPEAPVPASSEEELVVAASVAATKRIFPELATPEPAKPEIVAVETSTVVEVAAAKRIPSEAATIEPAIPAEVDAPVATKPLFPRASTAAPFPSVPSLNSSSLAVPKAPAVELSAAPAGPEKQPEVSSSQDIAH